MAAIKKYNGSTWETTTARKYETATETIQSGDTIYADGTAATVSLKGNEEHTGTPSPSNPVVINGTGDRTKNLLKNDAVSTEFRGVQYTVNADKSVTVYGTASPQTSYFILMGDGAATNNLSGYTTPIFKAGDTLKFTTSSIKKLQGRNTDGTYFNDLDGTITLSKDLGILYVQVANGASFDGTIYPMVTLSTETNTDYEPYGYKIPISNGQQTTNIYLGSTQTVRQIKKLVFDGTENWSNQNVGQHGAVSIRKDEMPSVPNMPAGTLTIVSSHFKAISNSAQLNIGEMVAGGSYLNFDYDGTNNLTDFKAFLAAQYANGTPVTIWYVLATAETAAVNEPLMKIGDYADTLSNATAIPTTEGANSITVDTTVQPSEFTATWTGWHDSSVKEWDGTDWN